MNEPDDAFEQVNPYAPSEPPVAAEVTGEPLRAVPPLGRAYWITFTCILLGLIVLTPFLPGITIPLIIACALAAVRVPIIQKRVLAREPQKRLPHSLVMLLTSGGIVLMLEAAAAATFMAICIPGGLLLFTMAGSAANEGLLITAVFGGSILAATIVFFLIFNLSLRLPF